MNTITIEWLKAAGIRAGKTFAQTLLSMIAIGAALEDVNFLRIASVGAVAAILSILTSVVGLPEVGSDGEIKVDTSDPTRDMYSLELNDELASLTNKQTVKFTVVK